MAFKVKVSYGTLSVKPYWPETEEFYALSEWFAGAFTICNCIVRPSFWSFIYPFVRYFLTLTSEGWVVTQQPNLNCISSKGCSPVISWHHMLLWVETRSKCRTLSFYLINNMDHMHNSGTISWGPKPNKVVQELKVMPQLKKAVLRVVCMRDQVQRLKESRLTIRWEGDQDSVVSEAV